MYSYPTQTPPSPVKANRSVWIIGGLALATLLCLCILAVAGAIVVFKPFSAKPTATPTATPRPTRTPRPSPTPVPLRIGLLVPLSGFVPTFGESSRDGALLAFGEWNTRGGLFGMDIQPIIEDSQCTADPAVNAANKLIDQDGVHYILGEVCSQASIAVSEIANSAGVLQISPSSINKLVTTYSDGSIKPYTFIIPVNDEKQARAMAQFATESLGAKTAFLMYDQQNSYTTDMTTYFEQYFTQMGGVVLAKEMYEYSQTEFSTILDKIQETNPDVVFLPDFYNITNLVAGQARQKGLTTTFLGGDGWDSTDLDLQALEGGFFTSHFSPDEPRDIVQDFIKSYGELYKNPDGTPKVPDTLAALAYDATNLLLAAIQKAGVDDPAVVKDVLAGMEYEGVTGMFTFDYDHTPLKSVVVQQIVAGEVVYYDTVYP